MIKNILAFYATVGVPLFYLYLLYIINSTQNTLVVNTVVNNVGLIMGVFGILLWLLSYINLGKAFGVLPQEQKKVKRGVYRSLKHPMYIGISMTFLGMSIAMKSLPGLIMTIILLVPLLIIRAWFEERKLEK